MHVQDFLPSDVRTPSLACPVCPRFPPDSPNLELELTCETPGLPFLDCAAHWDWCHLPHVCNLPVETLVCISLVSTKLTSGPLFLLCRGEQDGHAAA